MNVYILILETAVLMILTGVCSEMLAIGTEELEKRLDKGMAGGVILGIMTAFPETVFVIFAILDHFYQVALGSAIGGNMILFTVGMGIVSVTYFLKYKASTVKLEKDFSLEIRSLAISIAVFMLVTLYGELNVFTGVLSLVPYVYYVTSRYRAYMSSDHHEGGNILKGISFLLAGGIPLVIISDLFVSSIENLAIYVNVPPILVSMILMPIAGELEEKISAIRLIVGSPSNVTTAVMSFVGSKIENMSVLTGIIGIFSYGGVSIENDRPEFLGVILVTVVATLLMRDRKLGIREGISLILFYFVMIGFLTLTSA
ncbi:sodium:calcium antiporter [Sulfuracidifex tepidarius]|uniref:Sodium/calcium exchanger membrane region domain-containing protein n=1 Tax=Sulfuracidifex tepidarius TaxID=1294262 RepID=A0A510DXT5_9CREN|nr:sodium:calcium antiporter [Sulfuracidifex tepidarius]BBG24790.1 hypothetical protein IC006_2124 [Sulfuracidifex tepidarius]BBG27576.1 hypothetical protein IC007_2130 [Sulfuracidifex tepidarius]